MDLREVMQKKHFVVAGDTLNPEKYAFKIKEAMLQHGYEVVAVGKELASLNEVPGEIEVLDLCIHPAKGIALLRECTKHIGGVVVQPGAESEEILSFLTEKEIPWMQGCLLVGLKLYVQD